MTRATAAHQHWHGVRRVLAVRLDNLGDLLMTTPALSAIRESLPGVHLTVLTSPAGALAAPHLPMVDAVWPFSAPWVKRDAVPAGAPLGRQEAAWIERLAGGSFDAAVIFTVCTQSALPAALMCRLAGIPLRAAHCRENPYGLLTDWVPDTDQVVPGSAHGAQPQLVRHEVQRQLALVAALGLHTEDDRLRFVVLEADRRRVAAQMQAAGIAPGQSYAVLHPGASAPSRRWPAPQFGQAARLLADSGCTVVFAGDAGDVDRVAQAQQAMADGTAPGDGAVPGADLGRPVAGAPVLSLAGRQTLGELAALIEGARVLVANNSAAAHLAAALGTPVVDLYALTNPQHTPWRVRSTVLFHDVPCRWCQKSLCPLQHHDCLRRVDARQVGAAALELMRPPQPAAREMHA